MPNNGDIIIIPRPDEGRSADGYDEVVLNRIRYQVPEDTIVTDFWARLQGETPKWVLLLDSSFVRLLTASSGSVCSSRR